MPQLPYANLTDNLGAVLAARLATLHELGTVYGTEDLFLLIEVLAVDAHNHREAQRRG